MLTCPMCKKKLPGWKRSAPTAAPTSRCWSTTSRTCATVWRGPRQLTTQGELGEAVWAYLAVLEVDPDNATARRQVGQVATAVRQFDQTAPGRRWQKKLQQQTAFRRWMANWNRDGDGNAGSPASFGSSWWSPPWSSASSSANGQPPAGPGAPPAASSPAPDLNAAPK